MTQPAVPITSISEKCQAPTDGDPKPPKRPRIGAEADVDFSKDYVPPHPLGVRPSANAYTADPGSDLKAHTGFFSRLPDELLAHFLEHLNVSELLTFGSTCKALHAYCRSDDLWRNLFVESPPKDFQWLGTWRSTLLKVPGHVESKVACRGLYSDVLHRPWFCAHASLIKLANDIPEGNTITRVSDLTRDDFSTAWCNKPFILTEPVREWPIYSQWNTQMLLEKYKDVSIRAEAVDWPLSTYVDYMHNNKDESPLYLFDCSFAEKMNIKTGRDTPGAAYWTPDCFGDDLFAVLGDNRPDSRWMIMGPARSGSTFHKDPNATSAWNAVLTGSKYWLMFPSGANVPAPPGVIVSEDQSEITAPVSISEYLLAFHGMARNTPGCKEGICYAGEVLHVPSGWFHLVLNLEEGIALTQNFVPRKKLPAVLKFLKDTPDQVSGFKDDVTDPYALFRERLQQQYPGLLAEAEEILAAGTKKGKWEELTNNEGATKGPSKPGGFSFGFCDEAEEVDIPSTQ